MDNDLFNNVLNMFNTTKPFKIEMSCPESQKVTVSETPLKEESNPYCRNKGKEGTDYAKEYKQREDEEYLKVKPDILWRQQMKDFHIDNMSEITASMTSGGLLNSLQETSRIYRTYNFSYRPQAQLPICTIKNKILSMLESNSVIIISGSTGCGKTTQVPQIILNDKFEKNEHCNIIVTQPRRIAAMSIAKRVCAERDWTVGTVVGYQMGLIKNISCDTRITYCTTGVLLHKLINRKHMLEYTHVILDEVHERDEDMDFLMLVVKKLLRLNSPNVKVILMSATIDVYKFADYFSIPMGNTLLSAPIIDVPKERPYNISIYYIDEMHNLGNVPEVPEEAKFSREVAQFSMRILHIFDRLDKADNNSSERAAVLVFLPGYHEIVEFRTMLLSEKNNEAKWDTIILHSMISTEDQENIFKQPPKDYRRIILSTNIAESSITVPNVKYVIDFCLTKLLVAEPETNYECLHLQWASKANCQQRAGRVGRVMEGRVYRMISRSFYDKVLPAETVPEILRAPLEHVVLKTKLLNMGEPKALLAVSLDAPDLRDLRKTVLLLKETGALLHEEDNPNDLDGELTPLGRVMASLPMNILKTKLIVLGHLFGVLQDAIIMAACLSVKEIFNINADEIESTYNQKLQWAHLSDCDLMAYLNAYNVWRNSKMDGTIQNSQEEKQWARKYHLRIKSLREANALIADITEKLRYFGIKEVRDDFKLYKTWKEYHINRNFVLKVIIAGAFYPNYFVKSMNKGHKKNQLKLLPYQESKNTVVLSGWPLNQPGLLYAKKLQQIFASHLDIDQEDIVVSFDRTNRVYLENKNPAVGDFVQKCVKLRHLRIPITVDLLSEEDARDRSEALGLKKESNEWCFDPKCSQTHSHNQHVQDQNSYPDLPKKSSYESKVTLNGPFSPLEVRLFHVVASESHAPAIIDMLSVNSVILDNCPDEPKGIFLVAQTIARTSGTNAHLILRNTTLLPNIPGLEILLILIFTPYMELRRSPLGTYYTGALCGFGCDSKGRSLFPEHDLELLFDCEITMDDLRLINKLRHWMNVAMHFDDYEDMDKNTRNGLILDCQDHIKVAFSDVIYARHNPQEPVLIPYFNKWNRYDQSLFLKTARETSKKSRIYRLHNALELNEKNEHLEKIIKHLCQLEILAYKDPTETSIEPVYCELCKIEVVGILSLRSHLDSQEHKANQQAIDTVTVYGEDLQTLLSQLTVIQ